VSTRNAPNNTPGGPYRKPRANLYTVLLVIALLAILAACLCLYLEMQLYEFKFSGGPTVWLQQTLSACPWTAAGPPPLAG
jgi:hypothetical protein